MLGSRLKNTSKANKNESPNTSEAQAPIEHNPWVRNLTEQKASFLKFSLALLFCFAATGYATNVKKVNQEWSRMLSKILHIDLNKQGEQKAVTYDPKIHQIFCRCKTHEWILFDCETADCNVKNRFCVITKEYINWRTGKLVNVITKD